MGQRRTLREVCFEMYRKLINLLPAKELGRYDIVRKAYNMVMKRLKPQRVQIDGHTIFLDPLDSLALSIQGHYEAFQMSLMRSLLHKGEIMLDLGANIGVYTLSAARLVGDGGCVFAFELDLRIASRLAGRLTRYKDSFNLAFEPDHSLSATKFLFRLELRHLDFNTERIFIDFAGAQDVFIELA